MGCKVTFDINMVFSIYLYALYHVGVNLLFLKCGSQSVTFITSEFQLKNLVNMVVNKACNSHVSHFLKLK